jgi:hypothetical protein
MFVGLAVALIATFAMAAMYYLFPSLHLWRGTGSLISIFVGLGVSAALLVSDITTGKTRRMSDAADGT